MGLGVSESRPFQPLGLKILTPHLLAWTHGYISSKSTMVLHFMLNPTVEYRCRKGLLAQQEEKIRAGIPDSLQLVMWASYCIVSALMREHI